MERGLAGRTGPVHGDTTPSVTHVDVIGDAKDDYAINVFFEDRKETFWFAPELLELMDHGAGTEITLKGVPKKWVRSASGEWEEVGVAAKDSPMPKKPWWKFW